MSPHHDSGERPININSDPLPDLGQVLRRPPVRLTPEAGRRSEQALIRAERAARTAGVRSGMSAAHEESGRARIRVASQPLPRPIPEPVAPRMTPTPPSVPAHDPQVVAHIFSGVVWAVATVAAAVGGRPWLAAELAIVAAVAAGQVCRCLRRRGLRPHQPTAMVAALALPLTALGGPGLLAAVVAALVPAALLARLGGSSDNATADAASTVAAAVPVGLAAASVVLVRSLGLPEVLVLLALVFAGDAGAYLVGLEATSRWEAPAAAVVCTVAVTLVIAAFWANQFSGFTPLVLGGLAAVTVPLGPTLAHTLFGTPDARTTAVGRLDSLIATAPLWAWTAALLLR